MTAWQKVYSEEQREAVIYAANHLRIRPWRRIVQMAAAGELSREPGAPPLPPFKIHESSMRSIARSDERRHGGYDVPARVRNAPPRDRAHAVHLRLAGIIDAELDRLERLQRRRKLINPLKLAKLVKVQREIQALPDPDEKRLPLAGQQRDVDGRQLPPGPAPDSLAGRALRSIDRHGEAITPSDVVVEDGHERDVYTPENEQHEQHENEQHENTSEPRSSNIGADFDALAVVSRSVPAS